MCVSKFSKRPDARTSDSHRSRRRSFTFRQLASRGTPGSSAFESQYHSRRVLLSPSQHFRRTEMFYMNRKNVQLNGDIRWCDSTSRCISFIGVDIPISRTATSLLSPGDSKPSTDVRVRCCNSDIAENFFPLDCSTWAVNSCCRLPHSRDRDHGFIPFDVNP
jgi:hypothetical protein